MKQIPKRLFISFIKGISHPVKQGVQWDMRPPILPKAVLKLLIGKPHRLEPKWAFDYVD